MDYLVEALKRLKSVFGSSITGPKLALLLYLYFFGPQPMSVIVKSLGYTWSEIDRIVKKLEDEGLVKARKLPTRSGVRTVIMLTDRGVEFVEDIVENLQKIVQSMRREG